MCEHIPLSNGILLRSDVHRLFDAGYVTITPEYRVEASRRMKDDFDDGDNYLKLHGSSVWVPEAVEARPNAVARFPGTTSRYTGGDVAELESIVVRISNRLHGRAGFTRVAFF